MNTKLTLRLEENLIRAAVCRNSELPIYSPDEMLTALQLSNTRDD